MWCLVFFKSTVLKGRKKWTAIPCSLLHTSHDLLCFCCPLPDTVFCPSQRSQICLSFLNPKIILDLFFHISYIASTAFLVLSFCHLGSTRCSLHTSGWLHNPCSVGRALGMKKKLFQMLLSCKEGSHRLHKGWRDCKWLHGQLARKQRNYTHYYTCASCCWGKGRWFREYPKKWDY